MSTGLLTLNDVHRILRDRIGAGVYTVGSRLPSCRALAAELGTNPSTVDRALHRLAGDGFVRTSPRQGSVVTAAPESTALSAERFDRDLRGLVMRAQSAGLPAGDIQRMIADALASLRPAPRVAFVECNQRDLERMCALVERTSGIAVEPVLLADAAGRRLDAEYDAIATPIFHLRDLEGLVDSFDTVIEINAMPAPPLLRRLATLPSRLRVVVAAPTARGIDRMAALVGQYTPTPPERLLLGSDDVSRVAGAVLVRNNASDLPAEAASLAAEVLTIEWDFDNDFARTFPARVNAVVHRLPN
ncbi:winged helix-turn-helix domain-containing protein [Actinocorallia sp. A-T 12471]|uniref:winged helix-turn-helix domain-containing protein n=1 Tax=Actinocorallia sp. A-T 12471 TaxID=3089813 RepID=UPI0029D13813|nr:GntR family transcriptional regulator [Actinocorallia sp. A-T 12471]MDX6739633.1 GntR family transcriptional regulator [Actinocorallia sp. A-T 12471]